MAHGGPARFAGKSSRIPGTYGASEFGVLSIRRAFSLTGGYSNTDSNFEFYEPEIGRSVRGRLTLALGDKQVEINAAGHKDNFATAIISALDELGLKKTLKAQFAEMISKAVPGILPDRNAVYERSGVQNVTGELLTDDGRRVPVSLDYHLDNGSRSPGHNRYSIVPSGPAVDVQPT